MASELRTRSIVGVALIALALGALLAGILGFFMLEKLVIWRHCHTADCDAHDSSAALILVGGSLHNFTDGAIVGAAVVTVLFFGLTVRRLRRMDVP